MQQRRQRLVLLGAAASLAATAAGDAPAKVAADDVALHVASLRSALDPAVSRVCKGESSGEQKQACASVKRFHQSLSEAGHRLVPSADDDWEVLEGAALRHHPDPLGALQRGEVPAVMLRQFVPQQELQHMLSRLSQITLRVFSCRFNMDLLNSTNRKLFTGSLAAARSVKAVSNDKDCQELNEQASRAQLSWPHWCALLTHVQHDCAHQRHQQQQQPHAARAAESEECKAVREDHPIFDRCQHDYGKKRQIRLAFKLDRVVKAAARELGHKLYGNLQPTSKQKYLRGAAAIDALHEFVSRGCTGRFCSPKHAMIAGMAELARKRGARQAEEVGGERHSPGTIRAMTAGWITPLHMDSKHSNAWAALRQELCGEKVTLSMGTSHVGASRFGALTRHPFAASAIFTMHAPDRNINPIDLNIFRVRWPALLHNCSVRTVDAYGVGARFQRETMPPQVLERPIKVQANPGDLFLFNSEFFHDTPRIVGMSARTVFNSFAGYSADPTTPIELYA